MLNEKMHKALCEQLNRELYSGYIYLSMSSYFEALNLTGFASWMRVQAQEELVHAMKFFDFIQERGHQALLAPIEGPPTEWDSPAAAFANAFEHEVFISKSINKLVDLSLELSDHATNSFLQWFVTEQVEEEASADEVVQRLKLVGSDGPGLFMLDREMATRTFTPAPAEA